MICKFKDLEIGSIFKLIYNKYPGYFIYKKIIPIDDSITSNVLFNAKCMTLDKLTIIDSEHLVEEIKD